MRARAYDEMFDGSGAVRPHYAAFAAWLSSQSAETLARKREEADLVFHRLGITFAVHGEAEGTERLIPFDQIPRILPVAEWTRLAAGDLPAAAVVADDSAAHYHRLRLGQHHHRLCLGEGIAAAASDGHGLQRRQHGTVARRRAAAAGCRLAARQILELRAGRRCAAIRCSRLAIRIRTADRALHP